MRCKDCGRNDYQHYEDDGFLYCDKELTQDFIPIIPQKKNALISVVLPVYNGEMFLEETIKSILNQTHINFELIIVNDGSTDKTKKIIEKYMMQDNRIKYLENKENKGFFNLHNVINKGYSAARGKYISHFCADDIAYPNKLEVQYNYLEKHKDIFLVGCSADAIDKTGKKIGEINKKFWHRIPFVLKSRIAFSNPFIYSSIMFRNKGDILTPSYAEHLWYSKLMFEGKKLINLKERLMAYRINPYGAMAQHAEGIENARFGDYYKPKS